jgi:hypothetical protein
VVSVAGVCQAQQVMWKDNPLTGRVVGLTYGTSGWTAAEAQAVAYGGHLVTVRSQSEQDWLVSNLSAYWGIGLPNQDGPWIGLHEQGGQGSPWIWTSGEPVSFLNWWVAEPNNSGGNEVAVHMLPPGNQYRWNDAPDSFTVRSLVEVAQRPPRSWSWPAIYPTGSRPDYGCTFDMDGDGDLDYASPDRDQGQVTLWRNNGQGLFVPDQTISQLSSPTTIIASDWDRDGDKDLIVSQEGGKVDLLTMGISGSAWNQQALVTAPSAYGLCIADLNSDGQDDLIVSSVGGDDKLRVWLRNADGSLAACTAYGPYFDEAYQPFAADLDADGHLDMILAGGAVRLFHGSASGALTDVGGVGLGRSLRSAAVDLNADGRKEILITRADLDTCEVWASSSTGALSTANYALVQSFPCGDFPHWIEVADLDGDGDFDAVVPSAASGTINVLRNTKSGLVTDHVLTGQNWSVCVAV